MEQFVAAQTDFTVFDRAHVRPPGSAASSPIGRCPGKSGFPVRVHPNLHSAKELPDGLIVVRSAFILHVRPEGLHKTAHQGTAGAGAVNAVDERRGLLRALATAGAAED